MDEWPWEQLEPWRELRTELPVGPLFCVTPARRTDRALIHTPLTGSTPIASSSPSLMLLQRRFGRQKAMTGGSGACERTRLSATRRTHERPSVPATASRSRSGTSPLRLTFSQPCSFCAHQCLSQVAWRRANERVDDARMPECMHARRAPGTHPRALPSSGRAVRAKLPSPRSSRSLYARCSRSRFSSDHTVSPMNSSEPSSIRHSVRQRSTRASIASRLVWL